MEEIKLNYRYLVHTGWEKYLVEITIIEISNLSYKIKFLGGDSWMTKKIFHDKYRVFETLGDTSTKVDLRKQADKLIGTIMATI